MSDGLSGGRAAIHQSAVLVSMRCIRRTLPLAGVRDRNKCLTDQNLERALDKSGWISSLMLIPTLS